MYRTGASQYKFKGHPEYKDYLLVLYYYYT